jgi:hypothetical protein
MLTHFLAVTAVTLLAAAAGFGLGSLFSSRQIRDHFAATRRLASGARRFVVAHLPRSDEHPKVAVAVGELERLLEMADACERTVGEPVPPMPLARRILKACALRRSGSTQRIAA